MLYIKCGLCLYLRVGTSTHFAWYHCNLNGTKLLALACLLVPGGAACVGFVVHKYR